MNATTFVFEPPSWGLYLIGGIIVLALVGFFVSRKSPARKLIGLVVVAAVAPLLYFRIYQERTLTLDETSITGSYSGAERIAWSEVKQATYVAKLSTSPYRLTNRMRGSAIGNLRFGKFKLANGEVAQVALEQSQSAILIKTDSALHLFAPNDIQRLAKVVANHVRLNGWEASTGDAVSNK